MYAVIKTGGRQAKVREGDVLDVERLRAEGEVEFDAVLVVGDDGSVISDRDQLAKSAVKARVLGESRGKKVDVFHYRNKSGYRKSAGHRQTYTTVEITEISAPGAKKATAKKAPAKKSESDKTSTAKAPAEVGEDAPEIVAEAAGEEPVAEKPPIKKASAKKQAASTKPAATEAEASEPAAENDTGTGEQPATDESEGDE